MKWWFGSLRNRWRSIPWWTWLVTALVALVTLALLSLATLALVIRVVLPLYVRTPEVRVPHILGLPSEEALDSLKAAGLLYRVVSTVYSDAPEGTVLEASPAPGMRVKRGRTVELVLSRGHRLVPVPDVVNLEFEVATEILTRDGFQIGDVSYVFSDSVPRYRVIRTDPPAGEMTEPGTPVHLEVSLGPLQVFPDSLFPSGASKGPEDLR